jgi:hypothetical protein
MQSNPETTNEIKLIMFKGTCICVHVHTCVTRIIIFINNFYCSSQFLYPENYLNLKLKIFLLNTQIKLEYHKMITCVTEKNMKIIFFIQYIVTVAKDSVDCIDCVCWMHRPICIIVFILAIHFLIFYCIYFMTNITAIKSRTFIYYIKIMSRIHYVNYTNMNKK